MPIDPDIRRRQRAHLCAGDEGAPSGANRPEFGDWLTVARDDEGLTGRHRLDHLRVLVAQVALRDYFRHTIDCSELCDT